jgi:hypothetical protein
MCGLLCAAIPFVTVFSDRAKIKGGRKKERKKERKNGMMSCQSLQHCCSGQIKLAAVQSPFNIS